MDRAALDRPGADEGDLDHEVVEAPRLEARQGRHLRPRLDLEHADRVGAAQHGVDVVVLGDRRQVDLVPAVLAHEVDRVVQRREHPETEQVELDEAGRRAVVLVPLQHRPLVHPRPLDRAHLDHRAITDHHATGMDPEMAGSVLDLPREVEDRLGDRAVVLRGGDRDTTPCVDLLRPGVLLPRLESERLGHVADRRTRTVGDDVGDLCGVVAAVPLVHVLDHLLSPIALDVDVDVGRAVALGRQEALEQQAERHRIGGGDAERVADRRVRRAAPPLAEDVRAPAELDDVPHDEEVAGEAELLDQRQFVIDRRPRPSAQREVFAA